MDRGSQTNQNGYNKREMENAKATESMFPHEVQIKNEPLDKDSLEACENVYDSLFEVVKQEVCSDSLEVKQEDSNTSTCVTVSEISVNVVPVEYTNVGEHSQAESNLLAYKLNSDNSQVVTNHETGFFHEVPVVNTFHMEPNNMNSYPCSLCNYQCAYKSDLEKHMYIHTVKKSFSCKQCDFECLQSSTLKHHMIRHTGVKTFSCKHCDYTTSIAKSLRSHVKTHTSKTPYSCKHCDYKSTRISTLRNHIRTHTGEKPYLCEHCDFKCAQTSTLKNHMVIHTGVKPHSCQQCDNKFTRASSLKLHMMTHTGEKPFSCKDCDYKGVRASHLASHRKTHHRPKT